MSKRSIELDDLLRVRFPQHAAVSPDGRRVVFALSRLDYETNEIRGALWLIPSTGDTPVPFTADEARDTSPTWSPDGRWIAFLSNRSGTRRGWKRAPMQLWIIPVDGGEARQLTAFKAGVTQFAWAPDGQSLAFVTRGKLAEPERDPDSDEIVVREITRPKYKFDAMGFLDGYAHVWTVPAAGGTPVQLTAGDFDHESPVWLPTGREIIVVANRNLMADLSTARDLWAVSVQTRAVRPLTHKTGPCVSPSVSPDGRWISFVGHDYPEGSARNSTVWVVPSTGGAAINLTAAFDHSVGNAVGTDVRLVPLLPSTAWTAASDAIIFFSTAAGRTNLYTVRILEKTIQQLTEGDEVIADVTAAGGVIVYQRISPTSLDELWVLAPNGRPRRLAGFNDDLLGEVEIRQPQRFTYEGADSWPMEGWVLTPPGFNPAKTYPAILRIHGGPHAAFGEVPGHYPQLLAANGYVVVSTNPRGSQGYGEAFTRSVVTDWGTKDSEDILRGLDHVLAQGFVDPKRTAVTGGSYGGFMTNWLITHTNRFRCAVTEVCISNIHSFYGTSDIGATWGEVEWGTTPWDDPTTLLKHSPLQYVKNVTTPVLITANEQDHRCPVEQSEQFFIALRKLGKDATFLRFQGESHTMGSNGRPKPRIERLRRLLAWFNKHLEPAGSPTESRPAVHAGN